VELAVIRCFFRAPRLVLTVATIGLAQILTGIAILLPMWWDTRLLSRPTSGRRSSRAPLAERGARPRQRPPPPPVALRR
jgi:hypothetical protein